MCRYRIQTKQDGRKPRLFYIYSKKYLYKIVLSFFFWLGLIQTTKDHMISESIQNLSPHCIKMRFEFQNRHVLQSRICSVHFRMNLLFRFHLNAVKCPFSRCQTSLRKVLKGGGDKSVFGYVCYSDLTCRLFSFWRRDLWFLVTLHCGRGLKKDMMNTPASRRIYRDGELILL